MYNYSYNCKYNQYIYKYNCIYLKNCTVCKKKLDVVNYLKHRTVCKTCYNKNRRKLFEPLTKDMTHSSKEISLALEGLKNKLLEALELLEVLQNRT